MQNIEISIFQCLSCRILNFNLSMSQMSDMQKIKFQDFNGLQNGETTRFEIDHCCGSIVSFV